MPYYWIKYILSSFVSDFFPCWRATEAAMVIEIPYIIVRKMILWRELYRQNVLKLSGRGLFYQFAPTPLPIFQKFNQCSIVKFVVLVVWWVNVPLPSKLFYQKEQFQACSVQWICCSIYCLLISICFHVKESPVSHFLLTGFDLWPYFALKKSPHRIYFPLMIHHCSNLKDL